MFAGTGYLYKNWQILYDFLHYQYQFCALACVQGAAIKRPLCAKCIIVAVVPSFADKFSYTVPEIVYRLQY